MHRLRKCINILVILARIFKMPEENYKGIMENPTIQCGLITFSPSPLNEYFHP